MKAIRNMHANTLAALRRTFVAALSLFCVLTAACRTVEAQTRTGDAVAPDLSIGADRFPNDDAIILRWEQSWTLDADGAVHRRDHQWLKLLNSRPIREVADPRIAYNMERDKVVIHTAQTYLPDGTTMPVPDYSFNIAAPNDVAGWPQYAPWQEKIVSFSGLQDNATIDLDYEVITEPGVYPWIDADLRLEQEYPTVERVVCVTVPTGTTLLHRIDNLDSAADSPEATEADGSTTYRWVFRNLKGSPHEPQSPPWQRHLGRLQFTTCPSESAFVGKIVDPVMRAAEPSERIAAFASDAIADEREARAQADKVAAKIRETFNVVNSPKTWRSLQCRPADTVLESNYGSPLEAAALCAAALRSLGRNVGIDAAFDDDAWNSEVPTDSALDAVVVRLATDDGPLYVHPTRGVLDNPGSWSAHTLIGMATGGDLQRTNLRSRGQGDESRINITGTITLSPEGKPSGELRMHLTGGFFDPADLRTADAQEKLAKQLAGRVLKDASVESHSIAELSANQLRATVKISPDKPLTAIDKQYVVSLGDEPVFLSKYPLPLAEPTRETPVDLRGPFSEQVDISIRIPDGWNVAIAPTPLDRVEGDWGLMQQTVKQDGETIRLSRTIKVTTRVLSPGAFAAIRDGINMLRADASHALFVSPT